MFIIISSSIKFDTDIKVINNRHKTTWSLKSRNNFEIFYNETIKLCSYNVDNENNILGLDSQGLWTQRPNVIINYPWCNVMLCRYLIIINSPERQTLTQWTRLRYTTTLILNCYHSDTPSISNGGNKAWKKSIRANLWLDITLSKILIPLLFIFTLREYGHRRWNYLKFTTASNDVNTAER